MNPLNRILDALADRISTRIENFLTEVFKEAFGKAAVPPVQRTAYPRRDNRPRQVMVGDDDVEVKWVGSRP